MIYALNLAEDKRILSACVVLGWREGEDVPKIYNSMPVVEMLPEGDLSDYLYMNGEYVHDPLPIPDEPEQQPTQEERIAALEQENAELKAHNEFIEECLIEMSMILYA